MQQEKAHFLIITGMSGAGKTQVLRTLEDLNFFCVDNLPPALMPKFAELCRQTPGRDTALVVDTRGGIFFDKFNVISKVRVDFADKLRLGGSQILLFGICFINDDPCEQTYCYTVLLFLSCS